MNKIRNRGYLLDNIYYIIDNPIVISFTGEHGEGKTTIAYELMKKYKHSTVVSLATPVKTIAYMFGYREDEKRTNSKNRTLLEEITMAGFNYDADFWTNKLTEEIHHRLMYDQTTIFFIDDSQYWQISKSLSEKYKYFREYTFTRENKQSIIDDIDEYIINIINDDFITVHGLEDTNE